MWKNLNQIAGAQSVCVTLKVILFEPHAATAIIDDA